jgi:hypothetical protein
VFSRVLHNWADEGAVNILRRVRAAMPAHARLIVLEECLPEPGAAGPAARSGTGMVDLLMLVTLEGRDRTEAEYRRLLDAAGFDIVAARRADGSATDAALEGIPQ